MNPRQIIAGLSRALAQRAINHPLLTLALTGIITLAAASGVPRLKLRADGYALVPSDSPEVRYDQQIRDQFGIEDRIIVLVRASDTNGIFNPRTLQLLRDLTTDFQNLPGINPSNVISLATEPGFRKQPGTITPRRLLEPPLESPARLAELREDLRRIQLYTGTLVSFDGQAATILIGVPAGCDRNQLIRQIQARVGVRQSAQDLVSITGTPVAEALLGNHILEDLGVPSAWLREKSQLVVTPQDQRHTISSNAETTSPSPIGWERAGVRANVNQNSHDLQAFIARHIGLAPLAVMVMVLFFLLTFRNPVAALLPLPGVGVTLLSVFGLMGWAGVPIYLTTAILPVLLIATGMTNDIYLFMRYFNLLSKNPGAHLQLLGETFDKLAVAVAITSLATSIGFFSFALSPLEPVRAFGLWAGMGVLFGLLCSLTILPALLAILPPSWLLSSRAIQKPVEQSRLTAFFARMGKNIVRWRAAIIVAVIIILALTPLGLRKLIVQDSWIGAFDPDSELQRTSHFIDASFLGSDLLFVCLDATELKTGELSSPPDAAGHITLPGNVCRELPEIEGSPITLSLELTNTATPRLWRSQLELPRRAGSNIFAWIAPASDSAGFVRAAAGAKARYELAVRTQLEPESVDASLALAAFVRGQQDCGVGGVIGPYEYLTTTRFMTRPDDPAARQLLPFAIENRTLWDYYRIALGPGRLRQIVDTNYSRTLTTVFIRNGNFADTARLMRRIRSYEQTHLAPHGITLGFAGDVAVSQSLIHGIVTTQLQSLLWSLAGIFAVTAVLGGSWRWGVYCVLPSLLAVLIKFAAMGWLGVPLGVATSMFAAMTLGIGVNCAIQLLEVCRDARAAGAASADALGRAISLTGPPALVNTAAVSLGFGVLLLSQVPANARLGLLVVLGLVNCFVLSLLLLPVLLHRWPLEQEQMPHVR